MITETGAFRARWSVAMVLIVAVMVGIGNIAYTHHAQHEADRRWCAVLERQATPDPPPTTPRGWALISEYQTLHEQFGCEDR